MEPARLEAYVDAAAAAIDLPIDPHHRPGVLRYFALAAGLAEQVMALPLGVEDDPAERFEPVGPETVGDDGAARG